TLPAMADTPAALDWLRQKQAPDGGFAGDFDEASSVGATVEAVFAIVAAGQDPAAWTQGQNTPLTFLQTDAPGITLPGDLAKTVLAAVAAGANPRDFGGVDLIAALEATFDAGSGLYGGLEGGSVFGQSLAVLALHATRQPIPAQAVEWLAGTQIEDGSWSWNGDTTPGAGDTNSAAIAVQALLAAGYSGPAIDNALAYFDARQNEDGGFPYQKPSDFGTDTDANSTAYVAQALLAAGRDASAALAALQTLQNPNGAFRWQAALEADNFLATTQAVAALSGNSFIGVTGTMDAGTAPVPAPAHLPQSGGALFGWMWLLAAGLALLGGGAITRRATRHL
ncbi:MAG: prenyltransferase/squalene oxidase repeat-containing protein, partial [Anaerolineae bacterium]